MSETKHTPGPWEVGQYPWAIEADEGRIEVAQINPVQQERLANARLVAAAPDLLAACEDAAVSLKFNGASDGLGSLLGDLRAAIAKAKEG